MFRRGAETERRTDDEIEPAMIRWMPLAVPLAAALVLGVAFFVWWSVVSGG